MTPLIRHADRAPHCVEPVSRSGLTREQVHGKLRGMDEEALLESIKPMLGKVSKWLFWIALAGLIPFAWHIGWFSFERIAL